MNWKGYLFCVLMMSVAVASWLHPMLPAAAANPPEKYEYQCLAYPQAGQSGFVTMLNTQGMQGWRFVDQRLEGCVLLAREKQ